MVLLFGRSTKQLSARHNPLLQLTRISRKRNGMVVALARSGDQN
jgi:hypothetical protein